MRHLIYSCAAASALALLTACAPAPAPDTRDADTRAVRDLEAAWSKDAATKNADTFAKYYADDAVLLMPNAPILKGKQAIADAMKGAMSDPNFALDFTGTSADAAKSGDMVYTVGTYNMTMSDPQHKPMTDKGKYMTVFKKQADGSWKAVADMINSDMPMPAPPAK